MTTLLLGHLIMKWCTWALQSQECAQIALKCERSLHASLGRVTAFKACTLERCGTHEALSRLALGQPPEYTSSQNRVHQQRVHDGFVCRKKTNRIPIFINCFLKINLKKMISKS